MKNYKKGFFPVKSGFTLIELLIVIAIIGILAATVILGLNPVAKINAANDTTVKSNVDAVATALNIFAGTNGYFPATNDIATLSTAGDLTAMPTTPTGAVYTWTSLTSAGAACTTALKNCSRVAVSSGKMFAPVTAGNVWCWISKTGTAAETTVALCAP